MRNAVVVVQILTYGGLGILFWKAGAPRLAVAQVCYGVAACFLFLGVK